MVATGNTAPSNKTGADKTGADRPTIDKPPSSAAKRFGYVVGAAINLLMLWAAHQLLDWDWPRFLTNDFEDVLPWITASCIVSVAGYVLMFAWVERLVPKLVNDAATAGASFMATLSMWRVFPFDFDSYDVDWSWLIRLVLVVALIGSVIGFVVAVVKLITWPLRQQA